MSTYLTVHAISHAAMPRYAVPKVLNFETTLEAAGKESPKRSNDRGKCRQDHSVELHRQDTLKDWFSSSCLSRIASKEAP